MATASPPSPPGCPAAAAFRARPARRSLRALRRPARIVAGRARSRSWSLDRRLPRSSAAAAAPTTTWIFAEAGQLVRGDQVQVGGVPVGSVTDIELTPDYKARITIHVDSSLDAAARRHDRRRSGCRRCRASPTATSRSRPGPNNKPALPDGATLPASATQEVTDLDQLFNTLNPKTRKGLQQFIQGNGRTVRRRGQGLRPTRPNTSARSSRATDHFFSELVRDQPVVHRLPRRNRQGA